MRSRRLCAVWKMTTEDWGNVTRDWPIRHLVEVAFRPMNGVDRRTAILGGVAIGATPLVLSATLPRLGPGHLRRRLTMTHGARSGEVTTNSAVIWARASGPGLMSVRLHSNGRLLRTVRGSWAD